MQAEAIRTDEAPAPVVFPRLAWDDDGCLVDLDTGEVLPPEAMAELGEALPEGRLPDGSPAGTIFVVSDRDTADWALARRAEVEARLLALEARKRALVDNLDRQIRAERRRLAWWDFRFWPGVVGVARSLLKGRSRTAAFDHGKVSFRACPARYEINDADEALAWARVYAPRAIKVKEWVTATDVVAARAELEAEAGERVPLAFLVEHEARESVSIKTGVEV